MAKFILSLLVFCAYLPCVAYPAENRIVVEANNRLGFELYREFKAEQGNIFFSPYSVLSVLAMVYDAARGDTVKQMCKVLHLPQNVIFLRTSFEQMLRRMNQDFGSFKLTSANALWAQKGYPFYKDYLGILREYYGGQAQNLDFENDPQGACDTINSWVEDKTGGKIKDIISEGSIDGLTRLVLTNVVYFKGKWVNEFDKQETKSEDFKAASAEVVKVDMMQVTGESFNYAEEDGWQAIELPYQGGRISMFIILPAQWGMVLLEDTLGWEEFSRICGKLKRTEVNVFIPRFKARARYSMGDELKKLGMRDAFKPEAADFSGMTGKKDLFIGKVLHQAFVEVDEEGTEAAAATGVTMGITAIYDDNAKTFYADRPFIFIIQDKGTDNILFMGRLDDPTES